MKRIWAAWRMKYVSTAEKETGCIFCNALAKKDDPDSLILLHGQRALIILNKYPYTSGHVMVAPIAHQPVLEELDAPTRAEMMELASFCMSVLRKEYHAPAFNLGANIGEAAGAGVPGHVHLHIVPRWNGDTNFMSTIGEVRVLPESLQDTCKRLKACMVLMDGSK